MICFTFCCTAYNLLHAARAPVVDRVRTHRSMPYYLLSTVSPPRSLSLWSIKVVGAYPTSHGWYLTTPCNKEGVVSQDGATVRGHQPTLITTPCYKGAGVVTVAAAAQSPAQTLTTLGCNRYDLVMPCNRMRFLITSISLVTTVVTRGFSLPVLSSHKRTLRPRRRSRKVCRP